MKVSLRMSPGFSVSSALCELWNLYPSLQPLDAVLCLVFQSLTLHVINLGARQGPKEEFVHRFLEFFSYSFLFCSSLSAQFKLPLLSPIFSLSPPSSKSTDFNLLWFGKHLQMHDQPTASSYNLYLVLHFCFATIISRDVFYLKRQALDNCTLALELFAMSFPILHPRAI